MKLKCQCCGFEQEFSDGEEAFRKGWDAPPHFTGYVCCHICPVVGLINGHKLAHALWAREGRPKEFSFEKCADDKSFGDKKAGEELEEAFQKFLTLKTREERIEHLMSLIGSNLRKEKE